MSNTASNLCPAASDKPQPAAAKCHSLNSVKMFNGAREVIIEHAGDEYRLRLTS